MPFSVSSTLTNLRSTKFQVWRGRAGVPPPRRIHALVRPHNRTYFTRCLSKGFPAKTGVYLKDFRFTRCLSKGFPVQTLRVHNGSRFGVAGLVCHHQGEFMLSYGSQDARITVHETKTPKPKTRNPKPGTPNPKPKTYCTKAETLRLSGRPHHRKC